MLNTKVKEFSIICLLSFSIVIGCFVFCRGFLLNRHVFVEKSDPCPSPGSQSNSETHYHTLPRMDSFCSAPEPAFSKAIFILLDAFRYDFIHRMSFLSRIVERGEKENRPSEAQNSIGGNALISCAFKFIADPPTTTMQRLKALMSGTMPTFIDASANFNSYEVEEDNLIYQLHAAGKRTAFLGDDTWLSLFPSSLFTPPYVEAHPSFDAWDLDTVDRAVNASIIRLLEPAHAKNWDILIAHLLGVDHCGHRYGPNHPEMARKLTEADKTIEYVFNNMSPDTLLVVFGDHGMTKSGDHGGDSTNEIEAGIVLITKSSKRPIPSTPPPFQCISKLNSPQSVSQIDLVPTLSHLLGLPIPFSSIGQIFPKFLPSVIYSEALMNNVAQVYRYITEYATISNKDLFEAYNELMQAYKEYTQEKTVITTERLHRQAEWYLSSVKRVAFSTWTQFDMCSIYWGLVISFMAIFSITSTMSRHFGRVISWSLLLLSSSGLISVLLNFFLESAFGLLGVKVVTTVGLSLHIIISSSLKQIDKRQNLTITAEAPSGRLSSISSILIYIFTCVAVFSNSFVINEGLVLGSVLIAAACLHVLLQSFDRNQLQLNSAIKKSRGFLMNKKILIWRNGVHASWLSLLCLAGMVRIVSLFFRCREELTECQEIFLLHKQLTSLPEDWVVYKCIRFGIALLSVAIFVVTFREWMMMRECISSSRRPTALIGKYVPTILIVLTGAHWALEGLPFSIPHMVVIRPALSYFPLVHQTITLVAILIVWIQPLSSSECSKRSHSESEAYNEYHTISSGNRIVRCSALKGKQLVSGSKNGFTSVQVIDSLLPKNNLVNTPKNSKGKESRLPFLAEGGHQDVFTCSLLINCVLVILLLIQVTTTGITPAIVMIPYVIISILNLSVHASGQGSWSIVVIWTLASQYFFYSSGHQAVFSAIPWDSAFIGSAEGLGSSGSSSWINWIRPGLAVLGNLHVSQIIFATALPLMVYWKGHSVPETSSLGKMEISRLYSVGGKFIILHSVKLLACMFCATLHRRHLMVWKIFAPKLIFEIISFLVTLISTILSLLFVTRVDHHYQKMLARERKHYGES